MNTNSTTNGSLRSSSSSKELKLPNTKTATSRSASSSRSTASARPGATNMKKSSDVAYTGKTNKRKKPRKPLTKKKKLMILFISLGILLFLSVGSILAAKYIIPLYNAARGLQQDTDFNPNDIESNFSKDSDAGIHMDGFINIAVFGLDTRPQNKDASTQLDDSGSLSDVIMIISVNTDTKEVKLLSVYRDTYLLKEASTKGNTYDKINHAYSKGKAANALSLLNQNLDLNIEDYVTVNFSIVAQAIDAVGGIEIELESKEIEKYNKDGSYAKNYPLLNHYIDEINDLTGSDSPHITKPGTYLMDGVQATAFGRIRYCDTDYERTARQREVLMKLFEKAKTQGISKLLQIAQLVSPQVITSLSFDDIIKLSKYALNCTIADQQGFPFNQTSGKLKGTDFVFAENLAADVSQLHYYLFGKENYTPTSKVQAISDEIDEKRGKKSSSSTTKDSSTPDVTSNPTPTPDPDSSISNNSNHNTSDNTSDNTNNNSTAVIQATETPVQTQEPVQTQAPTPAPTATPVPVKTQTPTATPVKTQTPDTPTEVVNSSNTYIQD